MKWHFSIPLTVAMIFCMSHIVAAAPTLSLATTADLSAIRIGQPFSVDVRLSGLEAGEELDSLAATVAFDGNVLGTPAITAGPIVPNPLDDPLDLLIAEAVGLADVAFLTFGVDAADHITTNGIFYSFEVKPTKMSAGTIDFDFVGTTLFNAADPNAPIVVSVEMGEPLSFVVVPEPSSSTLMFVVLLGFLLQSYGAYARYESNRQNLRTTTGGDTEYASKINLER